jgi:hypothetical protein
VGADWRFRQVVCLAADFLPLRFDEAAECCGGAFAPGLDAVFDAVPVVLLAAVFDAVPVVFLAAAFDAVPVVFLAADFFAATLDGVFFFGTATVSAALKAHNIIAAPTIPHKRPRINENLL